MCTGSMMVYVHDAYVLLFTITTEEVKEETIFMKEMDS